MLRPDSPWCTPDPALTIAHLVPGLATRHGSNDTRARSSRIPESRWLRPARGDSDTSKEKGGPTYTLYEERRDRLATAALSALVPTRPPSSRAVNQAALYGKLRRCNATRLATLQASIGKVTVMCSASRRAHAASPLALAAPRRLLRVGKTRRLPTDDVCLSMPLACVRATLCPLATSLSQGSLPLVTRSHAAAARLLGECS